MSAEREYKGLTQLKITLNGDTPGLKDHRLSIAAFKSSLDLLLKAVRRIASGILTNALDRSDYGSGGGKYAQEARKLDLQIASIGEGSDTRIELVLEMKPPHQRTLVPEDELIFQVGKEFLESVDAESTGKQRQAKVRDYLASLDPGLTSQTYEFWSNGTRIGTPVRLGKLDFSQDTIPASSSYIQEVSAKIVGLSFPPDKTAIKLRYTHESDDGEEIRERSISCSATEEQVEIAVELRHEVVLADILHARNDLRILHLQRASEGRPPIPSSDQLIDDLMDTWDETLSILAK